MNDLSNHLRDTMLLLDRFGVDIGSHRLSLWSGLLLILVVLAIIVVARFGTFVARRFFRRMDRLDPTQQLLGEKIAGIAIWALTILVGIDMLGISLTALTVFSGAFGLAIGFGLQKTFGNLIAGIILLADRSIKPGDVIAVSDGKGSSFGEVKRIGIRAVSVTTRDNREYLIPNENLMTSQVENWSYSSRDVAIQIPVGVAYGSDLEQVEALLLRAAHETRRVLAMPASDVLLHAFGPSSIEMVLVIWINDPEMGISNVRSDVLKAVWRLFREHGVEIPFPQQDVHVRSLPDLPAAKDA